MAGQNDRECWLAGVQGELHLGGKVKGEHGPRDPGIRKLRNPPAISQMGPDSIASSQEQHSQRAQGFKIELNKFLISKEKSNAYLSLFTGVGQSNLQLMGYLKQTTRMDLLVGQRTGNSQTSAYLSEYAQHANLLSNTLT